MLENLLKNGQAKLLPWDDRYAVTKDGAVFSRAVGGYSHLKSKKWRELKKLPGDGRGKYHKVSLGRGNQFQIHVLVASCFIGKRPKGFDIRHLDGDPSNDSVTNLVYGTRKQNMQDARSHGTLVQGVECHMAILNEWDVRLVREMRASGYQQKNIAKKMGVHRNTIGAICRKDNWGWLDKDTKRAEA